MQYMLLIYSNEEGWNNLTKADEDALNRAHQKLLAELSASGEMILSNELSTTDAKVVRRGQDRLLVVDGPFTEAKEFVGGFYIVDVESIERAVDIAGSLQETAFAEVEIRALMH